MPESRIAARSAFILFTPLHAPASPGLPKRTAPWFHVSRETSRDETLDSTTIGSSVSRETLGYSWPKSD